MQADRFEELLALLSTLTSEQRARMLERLGSLEGADADAVTAIVEGRVDPRPWCPHCSSQRVVRNGRADGRQRYQCRACGRTFNALTGTPLARLRLREKWLGQARALEAGVSVRAAAADLGVHRTTAFRWRHRFLRRPSAIKASALSGVAEADETYVLRSYKGQSRRLRAEQTRRPRRRGGRAAKRGLSTEQVPILVVRDRSGQSTDFVLDGGDAHTAAGALKQALAEDALLCTDSSATLAAAARRLGIEHHRINLARGEHRRGPWHIQNVNAYHSRFKAWMVRFHGVATSYLPNYLGWFRALDRNIQTGAQYPALLALALASEPIHS